MTEPNLPEGTNPEQKPAEGITPSPAGGEIKTPSPVSAAPKPAPAKPAPAPRGETRRFWLASLIMSPFAAAWASFCAAMALMFLGTLRFLFPNVLFEEPSAFKVGPPDKFEEGLVSNDFKDKNAWIVRNEGKIYALSTTCTHLGCTPNWLEREQKFKCPCHGSGFYITGINFEGPAPRPLERWAVKIGDDGQIVVDKSRKFQQERGEWDNPDSYITV
jgi:cytochrome b6-f complex iron-sulfur subunit